MKAPARVETTRLVLSAPRPEDAGDVFERYASDPEVTLFLGWPTHQSVDDTRGFLSFSATQWEREGMGPYLIRLRANGLLIGSTGLGLQETGEGRRAATGYVLAKDAWGLGYATEVLTAMIDVAHSIGLAELLALCHPQHEASVRVLEKCGFQRDPDWTGQTVFPNLLPRVPQDVWCFTRSC